MCIMCMLQVIKKVHSRALYLKPVSLSSIAEIKENVLKRFANRLSIIGARDKAAGVEQLLIIVGVFL